MRVLLYRATAWIARYVGVWVVALFAWFVSTGYFLFRPRRVRTSIRFYRAVFPARGRAYALWLTWKQFHHFAGVFAERVRLERGGDVALESEGWSHLTEAKRGGVLLMSHVGNWEVAARLFQNRGLNLLLYVGAKPKEQMEGQQKRDLKQDGVELVVASADDHSPFSSLDGLRFLKRGGFVALPGDRTLGVGERTVAVRFMGHRCERSPPRPTIWRWWREPLCSSSLRCASAADGFASWPHPPLT